MIYTTLFSFIIGFIVFFILIPVIMILFKLLASVTKLIIPSSRNKIDTLFNTPPNRKKATRQHALAALALTLTIHAVQATYVIHDSRKMKNNFTQADTVIVTTIDCGDKYPARELFRSTDPATINELRDAVSISLFSPTLVSCACSGQYKIETYQNNSLTACYTTHHNDNLSSNSFSMGNRVLSFRSKNKLTQWLGDHSID